MVKSGCYGRMSPLIAAFAIVGLIATGAGANLIENPAFEEGLIGCNVQGWALPPKGYSVESGCGMNGTRALVFDSSKGGMAFVEQWVNVKPGMKLLLSCKVRTEGLVGCEPRNQGAAIGLAWFSMDGRRLGGADLWGPLGDTDWKELSRRYSGFGAEAAKAKVRIFVDRPKSGRAYFDDVRLVEVMPMPVDGMASSAYRDIAAEGRVTFAAGVNPASAGVQEKDVVGMFVFGGTECSADSLAGGAARIAIDVKKLPMGQSDVVFRLLSKVDGRILGAATNRFTRVARMPKRAVWFDSAKRAIVDGKPFFPLGMYCSTIGDKFFSVYTNSPFNCAMPYWPPDKRNLDCAQAAGIKMMYSVKDCWGGTKNDFYVRNGVKTDEDARAYVLRKVKELKGHPALLAWYVNDEADIKLMPKFTKRYRDIAAADPDHPAFGVFYQFADARGYMPAHDVTGIDPYPVPKDAISRVLDETRVFAKGTFGLMPAWHVTQAFDWTLYGGKDARPPTEDEMRNMTWQAIAGGANGIIYYAYHELQKNGKKKPFAESWGECCRVGEEVKRMTPVLLSDPGDFAVGGAPEHLGWRAWRIKNKVALLLVNATREKMEARLSIPSGVVLRSRVFGRGEAKQGGDGQLDVSFGPLDVLVVSFVRQDETHVMF